MIQINGWITIREAYKEEGEDDQVLESIVKKIRQKIPQIGNEYYELRAVNGSYHLSIMIDHNHRSEHVFEFFRWIGGIAPGSFGLLYVLDDEDWGRGNDNDFMVWRMRKGRVDELKDSLLSPINPTIEE